jgi:tetratricopeptide (TPR) repeat protein
MLSGQLLGDLEEVIAQARSSVEFLQGIGEHGFLSTSAAHLAETLLLLGRTDEAFEAVAVAQENAEPSDAVAMIDWMRLRAACLAALGRDLDEAERLARDAVASADGTDYLPSQADAYSNLAQVLRAAGRRDEARAAFGEAIRRYETKENLVWAARMRRAVGEL